MSDRSIPDVRGTGYSKEEKWIHDREREQAEQKKKQGEKGKDNQSARGRGDEKSSDINTILEQAGYEVNTWEETIHVE